MRAQPLHIALVALSLAGCGLFEDEDTLDDIKFGDAAATKVIKERLTEEELLEICNELIQDGETKAMGAQRRVEELQTELEAKEAALAEFEAKELVDEKKKAEATKRWQAMKTELETLRSQLSTAEVERDEARNELKQTLVQLDRQIAETRKFKEKATVYREKAIHYKGESTRNLWSSFTNNAKVEICDRGSRKRHEKCHEAVEAAMSGPIEAKFVECVDTYQARPELRQLDKKEAMPAFAQALADDNKFTNKGWVIVFCDPTLPEAGDKLLEEADPDLPEGGVFVPDAPSQDAPGDDF